MEGDYSFCWASFCSNWCSAISLDLQPALHLPKISPFICVYTCRSFHAGSFPALVPWETEGTGPCDPVLQFSRVYIFTCLTSVLNSPCFNLLCCLFSLCYFFAIAPPLLCLHALPPHPYPLLFPMQMCNVVTIASS